MSMYPTLLYLTIPYENFKVMNRAAFSTGTLSNGLDQLATKASEVWNIAS